MGGETKKEVALEEVKGTNGHEQFPQAPDTEDEHLTLLPATGPESVPCAHVQLAVILNYIV